MKKEDILRWIIYLGAGLLALMPLIVASSMFFPFITGKAFYFRTIVMIMFAAWAILALYDPRVRPRWSPVAYALGGLIVVALVASVFGVNPGDSIWSNFERMMGWITLLHVGLLFTVLGHTLEAVHWRYLLYFSLGISVIIAFLGFGEIPDENRIDATLGNPIYLAVYAMFHLLLAGYFKLRRMKLRLADGKSIWTDWYPYVIGLVGLLNLVALWFTKTRGALLGLAVGLFVALVLVAIFAKGRVWVRRIAIGLLILGVVVGGLFIANRDADVIQNNEVLSRFANISLTEGTGGSRLNIWSVGWEGYQESPKTLLIGWGPDNFNYVFNTYYSPKLFEQETWFDRAHNVVFEWLVAAGPLGALSYLALFGTAIYMIWRDPRSVESRKSKVEGFSVLEKSLLTGLVVAYLVQNLFVFDHLVSYWLLTMLLAWQHGRYIHESDLGLLAKIKSWFTRSTSPRSELSPEAKAWTGTGIALAAVVLLGVINYPGYAQATTLIDALRYGSNQSQQYDRALESYEEAIAYDAMGTQEARERLNQAAMSVADNQGVESDIAQQYFAAASQEMEAQIAEEPGDLRHNVFYSQLLMAYGQYEAAVEQLETANEMGNGQKQDVLFQLSTAHQAGGNTEEAVEAARQAYELDMSFDEPAIRYAAALIRADRKEEAKGLLEERFNTTAVDNNHLIQAYAAVEDFESILPIYENRLDENPNDPQSYVALAALLDRAGRDGEAISLLEELKEIAPNNAEQIDAMIDRVRSGEGL